MAYGLEMAAKSWLGGGPEDGEDGQFLVQWKLPQMKAGTKLVPSLGIAVQLKVLIGVQMVNISYRRGTSTLRNLEASFLYLLFISLDQTTRIHAPVRTGSGLGSWHEIARPQVHGYDLLNVVFIDPLKFASIADEKVLRVFEAPQTFVHLAEKLGVAKFSEEEV